MINVVMLQVIQNKQIKTAISNVYEIGYKILKKNQNVCQNTEITIVFRKNIC